MEPHQKIGLYAADGVYRTQDQWIEFFNKQEELMISARDVYRAGKSASDEVLARLRSQFVSSARISCFSNDLSGRITQNYGSEVVEPSQTDVVIPVYEGTPLTQALQSEDGIKYLQSLFDTDDDLKDIAGTLKHLSKEGADSIALWTPNKSSRQSGNAWAVWFGVYGGSFNVYGNGSTVVSGHSYGVLVGPQSGRAKK